MDTVIDFIRHGEPEGGRRFRGHNIDDPLSQKGWQQLWSAVAEQAPWSRLISSPLLRCRAFAEALSQRHGLPLRIEADFREVGFGCWEGLSPDQVAREQSQAYAAFYADPLHQRPEGAEPLLAFSERVGTGLARLLRDHPGEHLLVVAHAGVIRAVLGQVLQAPPLAWY
ncbi:MAG: histidine phosphatase family protein, partial [Gammaproteobacteria bacterium]|nr:histidine phosphatase family protein [Gammaproteobacteria bacterium]